MACSASPGGHTLINDIINNVLLMYDDDDDVRKVGNESNPDTG